jgi:hypothetical protein
MFEVFQGDFASGVGQHFLARLYQVCLPHYLLL